jgi:toxin ParE1/3/4
MRCVFHPDAEPEFFAAIAYYEDHEPGLGYDFAIEVHSTIDAILSFPHAWPIIEDDIRRCLVRRFPYGIIYAIDEDIVFILAVMHLHRDPEYWKERLK